MPPLTETQLKDSLQADLLSDQPRSGWRGRLLRMGRLRGVLLITTISLLLSLAVTAGTSWVFGATEDLPLSLLVAALVPLIVAPIVSTAAIGLLIEVEAARVALREVAVRDGLTALYNRRFFTARLQAEIERVRRRKEPHPLALVLVLVDIDHFKRINDTRGHAAGDQVLQHVAQLLHHQLRQYDIAARLGGEEFVLMLPDTTVADGLVAAERVRLAIEAMQPACLAGVATPPVTVSLGVAALDAASDDADALLRRADEALYRAKSGGRNRSVAADPPSKAA